MRILICVMMLSMTGVELLDAQCRGSRCRHRDRVEVRHSDRPGPAQFGIRGGYDFGDDTGTAGAQVRVPLIRQLLLIPSADVFFDDTATEWQLNADFAVRPATFGGVYAGAGAAFLERDFGFPDDDDVQVGWNVLLGLDGRRVLDTRLAPFVEGRWTGVQGYRPFRLVAGVNVPLR